MKSPIVKRSIVIAKHKTSVSVEDVFWSSLKGIAKGFDLTVSELVGRIDQQRTATNLSSAIRTFVLQHYRGRCGEGLAMHSGAARTPMFPINGGHQTGGDFASKGSIEPHIDPFRRLGDKPQLAEGGND